MMEVSVKIALKELGMEAKVDHTDLTTGKSMDADIYLGAKDIMSNFKKDGANIVCLENIIDVKEIKRKIEPYFNKV
jgi:PTS system ascorbate-specific IIB component